MESSLFLLGSIVSSCGSTQYVLQEHALFRIGFSLVNITYHHAGDFVVLTVQRMEVVIAKGPKNMEIGQPTKCQQSHHLGNEGLTSDYKYGNFRLFCNIGIKKQIPQLTRLYQRGIWYGAGDRARTGTLLPARDFKSLVSAIPPHRHIFAQLFYHQFGGASRRNRVHPV